jgi:hypothetical protein
MEEKRPMHPNSLANLTPVKPGEIRNPTGKNGAAYSAEYHRVAHEVVPEEARAIINKRHGCELVKEGDTWARANALAMHHTACCGLVNAAQEIRESTEGKAVQRVQMSGTDGAAAEHPTFSVVFTDQLEDHSQLELGPGDGTSPTE